MSKMLSSKHIFTILVTIVIAISYKPCVTINNVNSVNKIKLSFLQKDAGSQDTPDTVKSGETVEVVTNKDSTTSGSSKESSVDSHTENKEVDKHDQDKSVGEPTKKEDEQQSVDAKKGNDQTGSDEKKQTDTEGSKSADNTEGSKEAKVEVVKDTAGDQDSHVDAGKVGAKEGSGADHDEHEDHEEHEDHHEQDDHEHSEEHEEHDAVQHKDNAGDKEEHKVSGESENQNGSSDCSQKPADGVETKQTEAEAQAHNQEEHKPAETTADHNQPTTDHNQPTVDTQTADAAGTTESAPSKEATPEQTAPSNDGADASQVHEQASETHQENAQVVGTPQPHQPAQTPEATHVDTPAPTQPSTNTENVVKDHVPQATDTLNPAQDAGTSVAHQGNDTQVFTNPPTAPEPVDLERLSDDDKKRVVDFWRKASGDCSVDCTHSCRSALQGATQCVSVTDNSLNCSTFGDSATLTCPEGYTPCTQPVVTSLKSYTVKSNGSEVGALEVDGSNFSKCMGLALTTPEGRCDKATFLANLLFTAGALNQDYEINVAADKLTFGNLKIKNGDYRVCIFQRYEGSPEGMTISNIITRFMEFINPTSSTPKQTRTVFVMDVGTLRVSD